jgi:prefoldin subunit 5
MADRSGNSIIEEIARDRDGLIKQAEELRTQLRMIKGALQYIDKLLEKIKHE